MFMEIMRALHEQSQNLNREKTLIKYQTEIIELKDKITKIFNNGVHSR